jgi:hypothetical protein
MQQFLHNTQQNLQFTTARRHKTKTELFQFPSQPPDNTFLSLISNFSSSFEQIYMILERRDFFMNCTCWKSWLEAIVVLWNRIVHDDIVRACNVKLNWMKGGNLIVGTETKLSFSSGKLFYVFIWTFVEDLCTVIENFIKNQIWHIPGETLNSSWEYDVQNLVN